MASPRFLRPLYTLRNVQPPSELFIGPEDVLAIVSASSHPSTRIEIRGRILGLDGVVVPFRQVHTPATDRSFTVQTFQPAIGWLLGVIAVPTANDVRRGATFAALYLSRGQDTPGIFIQVLTQDYLTSTAMIGWPGGPVRASIEGPGLLRSIAGTDPAAGAEWSETVPTNARWQLHAVTAELATAVGPGNREVSVVVDDGAAILSRTVAATAQAAATTVRYTAGGALSPAALPAAAAIQLSLPREGPLLQGWRVRSLTESLQAGDNWGAPQLLVEEWIEE